MAVGGAEAYPDEPPHDPRIVMAGQRWEVVSLLHWRVPTSAVAALLPPGLVPDTVDGSAWASLTPLRMVDVTVPPLPPPPVLGTFPETNVRTYVVGPRGPALWFCSLDITRLLGVPWPRLIGQPYTWSRMRITERADEVGYRCRRRLPGPRGTTSDVTVRVGARLAPDPVDRWLVNRWAAYSVVAGRLVHTPVAHEPWRLHEADVVRAADGLAAAAGLPIGRVERVHHAPAVPAVRFGLPRLA